jgi:hypothetical protein
MTAAASAATGLVGDMGNIISTFSTLTGETVEAARGGITRMIAALPGLKPDLIALVKALGTVFTEVGATPEMTAASNAAAGFISDIAGIVSSLAGMAPVAATYDASGALLTPMVDIVDNAIAGARAVTGRAGDLGSAVKNMVTAFATSIGITNLTSLTDLSGALTQLSAIASSISGIVSSLANITAENVASAGLGGSQLGRGFYDGLNSWYDRILALAGSIVADTAAVLSGGLPGAGAPALAGAGGGGIVSRSYTDNSQRTFQINVYPQSGDMSDAEVKSLWSRLDQLDRDAGVAAARAALA